MRLASQPDMNTHPRAQAERVLLIHGLARTSRSMLLLAKALQGKGYDPILIDYPSTTAGLEELAEQTLPKLIDACETCRTHVVTHSMGGILLRTCLREVNLQNLGRTVMLGPPNGGSELVDRLQAVQLFQQLNGPASVELGTSGFLKDLPPVNFEVGVIAGDMSLNPVFNAFMPGPNDGKVTVEATKVDGMAAHLTVHTSHTFMMNNPIVIAQVEAFLRSGVFEEKLGHRDALKRVTRWLARYESA